MTGDAFTAGGIMVDNVVSSDGTVYREQMGGNAVYSAAGARLWLERVGIVGLIPANYPMGWLDRLRDGGLMTDGVWVVDETVACSEWFFYAEDGSRGDYLYADADILAGLATNGERLSVADTAALRAGFHHHPAAGRSFGAFRRDHPVTMAHIPPSFLAAAGVHLAPNRPDAQCGMARRLDDGRRRVTLDPGSNAETVAGELERQPARLDALLPSERELAVMAPGLPPAHGLARLIGLGARAAAVKLGPTGALVLRGVRSASVLIGALPVQVRDPTGAGDAFCGGFLAGLIRTGDPVLAACFATVSASFAVEAAGPFHLLEADRAEARRRLEAVVATSAVGTDVSLEPLGLPG